MINLESSWSQTTSVFSWLIFYLCQESLLRHFYKAQIAANIAVWNDVNALEVMKNTFTVASSLSSRLLSFTLFCLQILYLSFPVGVLGIANLAETCKSNRYFCSLPCNRPLRIFDRVQLRSLALRSLVGLALLRCFSWLCNTSSIKAITRLRF